MTNCDIPFNHINMLSGYPDNSLERVLVNSVNNYNCVQSKFSFPWSEGTATCTKEQFLSISRVTASCTPQLHPQLFLHHSPQECLGESSNIAEEKGRGKEIHFCELCSKYSLLFFGSNPLSPYGMFRRPLCLEQLWGNAGKHQSGRSCWNCSIKGRTWKKRLPKQLGGG